MRYRIQIFEIIDCVFTCGISTFLRHTGVRFNDYVVTSVFLPQNTSTWEQLKLFFWPYFLFTLLEYWLFGRRYNNFLYYKMIGLLLALGLYVGGYYIYTGIIGSSFTLITLSLFYFSIYIAAYNSSRLIRHNPTIKNYNYIGGLLFFLFLILFTTFTFFPLPIHLFAA